jgi:bacteriocin-like protein
VQAWNLVLSACRRMTPGLGEMIQSIERKAIMHTIIVSIKSCQRDRQEELTEAELANVSGGKSSGTHVAKVTFNPLLITKHIDKASPVLF